MAMGEGNRKVATVEDRRCRLIVGQETSINSLVVVVVNHQPAQNLSILSARHQRTRCLLYFL